MLAVMIVNGLLGAMLLYLLFGWAADRFTAWCDAHEDPAYDWSDPDAPLPPAPPLAEAPLLIRITAPILTGVALAVLLGSCAKLWLTRPS